MAAAARLQKNPQPKDTQIDEAWPATSVVAAHENGFRAGIHGASELMSTPRAQKGALQR
jgi:hypothetical protein